MRLNAQHEHKLQSTCLYKNILWALLGHRGHRLVTPCLPETPCALAVLPPLAGTCAVCFFLGVGGLALPRNALAGSSLFSRGSPAVSEGESPWNVSGW